MIGRRTPLQPYFIVRQKYNDAFFGSVIARNRPITRYCKFSQQPKKSSGKGYIQRQALIKIKMQIFEFNIRRSIFEYLLNL